MGRGRSGRVASSNKRNNNPTVSAQPVAPTPPAQPATDARGFHATDEADYHNLYNGAEYYRRQNLTDAEKQAAAAYTDSNTESGSLYSHSQNLNWLMMQNAANGRPITNGMNTKQLATYNGMMSAMHNLGYNVNLTRYDHDGLVNSLLTKAGMPNADFTRIPIAQLQKMLVGTNYSEERLVTTSYNNFKNAPTKTKGVFMNRAVRIEYRAKAGTQAMMPGNGPGGNVGEVVLAPSGGKENYRVVDVRYDNGVRVRRKGTNWLSSQRQLVLVVEV